MQVSDDLLTERVSSTDSTADDAMLSICFVEDRYCGQVESMVRSNAIFDTDIRGKPFNNFWVIVDDPAVGTDFIGGLLVPLRILLSILEHSQLVRRMGLKCLHLAEERILITECPRRWCPFTLVLQHYDRRVVACQQVRHIGAGFRQIVTAVLVVQVWEWGTRQTVSELPPFIGHVVLHGSNTED